MKRMKVLFGNRRMMVLLTLAILVLAATALVASSASFTATSANPDNVFTAGNSRITSMTSESATDRHRHLVSGHEARRHRERHRAISNTGDRGGRSRSLGVEAAQRRTPTSPSTSISLITESRTAPHLRRQPRRLHASGLDGARSPWAGQLQRHTYDISVYVPDGAAGADERSTWARAPPRTSTGRPSATDRLTDLNPGGRGRAGGPAPPPSQSRDTTQGAPRDRKAPDEDEGRQGLLSLAVLTLLAVALQSLVFSDASFTAGSANPANVFAAG